ncbi:glycoside hydrolase family 9 protein [candidate division KSB1 bacterium]|nr:glycoside hydrolase family 9 protein [candidate division KSB1 bacterium]
MTLKKQSHWFILTWMLIANLTAQSNKTITLNDQEYFETQGLNVLVFSNWYDGYFGDSKITGVEMIHHGVRTVTNGDVRLSPTPEQWDPIPEKVERNVLLDENRIETVLKYAEYDFQYTIRVEPAENGMLISVHLEAPLPEALEGKAGFNLEFLPAAYFEKTYMMDDRSGLFPLYPSGPTARDEAGKTVPLPILTGKTLVVAPEDPERRITIQSKSTDLQLFDGRNKAQNGWIVVRSMIPSDQSGMVIEWIVTASLIPNWVREPMIAYSQVGYHPDQKKVAVIELDKNDNPLQSAQLLKVHPDGNIETVFEGPTEIWGDFLRYTYLKYDFSSITGSGLYILQYGDTRTKPFRIAPDVYKTAWHATLDVYFPVQMDHMLVNEAYRVWHGASHLDDALQAPVNHDHFDLYRQGPTTDTDFEPGEHIPGLNVGGWFDAGDYDIRTQSQYSTVLSLVQTWETFRPDRDETTVDQKRRFVDIHQPDGVPDIIQQIEHGTLALIAQHRAVGHAINGIIVPTLAQYTHLGDALTMTDNLIYIPDLDQSKYQGCHSEKFDDRWAFTSKSTPLNYGSIAALAAASRALRSYNDSLAEECLATAKRVWDEEASHEPDIFRNGNTTGGRLEDEKFKAAVELLICTDDKKFAETIHALWPEMQNRLMFNMAPAIRIIPFMDDAYLEDLRTLVEKYKANLISMESQNPFGVPISMGTWAGSGWVIGWASTNYQLHKSFPDLIERDYVFKGLEYIYGCHPGSNISLVSGVGTVSKKVAYGNNRADYSFIAGGVVPGVLVVKPDFPENKEDWPFLWGENEYVIGLAASYLFLVNAVNDLLN